MSEEILEVGTEEVIPAAEAPVEAPAEVVEEVVAEEVV